MSNNICFNRDMNNREKWFQYRQRLEHSHQIRTPFKRVSKWETGILDFLFVFLQFALKFIGLYDRGLQNAKKLTVNTIETTYDNLPSNFDGLKILHLSDIHLDERPDLFNSFHKLAEKEIPEVDLVVITGDISSYSVGQDDNQHHIGKQLKKLIAPIKSKYGVKLVLGNHDSAYSVKYFEEQGIDCLINEIDSLSIGEQFINIIGLDDIHYFYTPRVLEVLKSISKRDFNLLLLHSCELYKQAETAGIDLYLSGHTHAGQIAFPFGYAPIRHLKFGRQFYKGLWKYNQMRGYTSAGLGTSGLPIRYNTQAEATIHILKSE